MLTKKIDISASWFDERWATKAGSRLGGLRSLHGAGASHVKLHAPFAEMPLHSNMIEGDAVKLS